MCPYGYLGIIIVMQKKYWQDLLWLTVLLAIVFCVLLGVRPLNTPDEGRYAEIAREMLFYHNYITPQLNNVVFFDKPPLVYWLMAASMKIFGVNEWAVRLIPALFAWLGCLMVYVTARTLYDRRAGWLAALMLATGALYFALAHYINMDMAIAVLVSIALQGFLLSTIVPQHRRRYLYLAYIACSLAVLTKGLIGLVFPLVIIGAWIMLCNQWILIKKMCLPTGLLIILLIACPWFLLVQQANPEFFHYFFVYEQFTRFTGQQFNNPQPFWFYVPVILIGFYPWITFTVPAIINAWPKWSQRMAQKNQVFILLWIAVIFSFFSIPQAKISSYMLPIFPALAILTAGFLSQRWSDMSIWRWPVRINLLVSIVLAIAVVCVANKTINGIDLWQASTKLYCLATVLVVGSIVTWRLQKSSWSFIAVMITILLTYWLALIIIPSVVKDSTKPLAEKLTPMLRLTDQVISYKNVYQDLPFYLQQRITVVADWNNPELSTEDNSLGQMAWSKQYQPDSAQWLIMPEQFWLLWHSQQRVFVLLDRDNLTDFIKQAHSPVYWVAEVKYTRLVSNQH